jgi:hypothetical protein
MNEFDEYGFEAEEYDREYLHAFFEELESKDFMAVVNVERYLEVLKAIGIIKRVFDHASERFRDEDDTDEDATLYKPVYDVGFINVGNFPYGALHLDIIIPEVGIDLDQNEVELIKQVLPDDCFVSIIPKANYKTYLSFNFKGVRNTFETE